MSKQQEADGAASADVPVLAAGCTSKRGRHHGRMKNPPRNLSAERRCDAMQTSLLAYMHAEEQQNATDKLRLVLLCFSPPTPLAPSARMHTLVDVTVRVLFFPAC